MQLDSAIRAEERARRDYERALRAAFNAETLSSQRRHARKAQVAASRMRDAMRDKARLSCDLEALREYRATRSA